MKEYFVIFILFTIFILYSVTLVSKDLNRMRCIEGFEDTYTFAQLFSSDENRANLCSTADQYIDFSTDDGSSTYQLQCYDQCSSTNTNVPVTDGRSNCKLPSDSNTSNCEVSVFTKCYLDNAFHESSSNVNMYCPDSGYADCGQCDVNEGTCSNVGGICQKTDRVTLPTGYARCTLSSSDYGVDHLTSDSNLVVSCEQSQCRTGISPVVTSLTRITDGSCSTLDCYGDAAYHSSGRFDITGRVLGIKIPQDSIKIHNHADGTLDFKYVILNFYRFKHDDSWNLDMSIGICKDTSKLMNPLRTDIINNIKTIFQNNVDDPDNPNENKNHIQHPLDTYLNQNIRISEMSYDPYSAEVITLHGGGYNSVYFNAIKEGNKFYNFWNTDKVTGSDQDRELWIYDNPIRVRFEFRKNSTKVAFIHRNRDDYNMNLNADVSFTQDNDNVLNENIADHYIFLKGGPSQNLHVSNLSFS
uniref:Uncharacterized protein n=1 Tax=viral metagenome TaxID=1070528 RepID=A0A6C0CT52_9ZZZZ